MKKIITALCLVAGILVTSISGSVTVSRASESASYKLNNPEYSEGEYVGINCRDIAKWDCIYFGNYYQSDATAQKKEPIKWRVLNTDGKVALLISDSVLDVHQYKESQESGPYTTWETSSARAWLNTDFMKTAFSEVEQTGILTTTVKTEENKIHETGGGCVTQDKIYLPSYEEMKNTQYGFCKKWQISSLSRGANHTTYMKKKARYIIEKIRKVNYEEDLWYSENGSYVLRTTGGRDSQGAYCVAFVRSMEQTPFARGHLGGRLTNLYYGIRPMLRIDLTKTSLWKYAGTVCSDGEVTEYQYKKDGTMKGIKKQESTIIKVPSVKRVTNAGNYRIKVTVNKVSGVNGYEYRYSTSRTMKKATKKSSKKTSYTTKSLKKNKRYYVSVRAYKTVNGKKRYSDWSVAKSIKTTKKKTVLKPSLSMSELSMTVGVGKTLKMNDNKKKVSWSVKKGKKIVSLSKKTKKSVCIKAKKEGTAKIQAKIGKKKYICTVVVKRI